jgi:hypothetical protein
MGTPEQVLESKYFIERAANAPGDKKKASDLCKIVRREARAVRDTGNWVSKCSREMAVASQSADEIRALNLNSCMSNTNTDQIGAFVQGKTITSEMEQALEKILYQIAVVARYKQEDLTKVSSIVSRREGRLYTAKCEM